MSPNIRSQGAYKTFITLLAIEEKIQKPDQNASVQRMHHSHEAVKILKHIYTVCTY